MESVNFIIYFHFSKNIFSMLKLKTTLKQINNKRTLVNLYIYCIGDPFTHLQHCLPKIT